MAELEKFVYFHDWYVESLSVGEGERLTLALRLGDRRVNVSFIQTSRCVVEHFGTLNIVYDIKLIQQGDPDRDKALALLTKTARTIKPLSRSIAWLTASAGMELVVEFESLEISEPG